MNTFRHELSALNSYARSQTGKSVERWNMLVITSPPPPPSPPLSRAPSGATSLARFSPNPHTYR